MERKKKEPERKIKAEESEAIEVTEPVEAIAEVKVEDEKIELPKSSFNIDAWQPKTALGRRVKNREITINEILDSGLNIMEPEIVDILLPDTSAELLMIGQAKGKFGGGQRRIFRQTQKKTAEGNKPHFATCAVIGNSDGIIGIGYGKSKETVPAREKALRNAKLNIIKIRRGCGSWSCYCRRQHSIPFKVSGKTGSVVITLIPAPKGTGLKVKKECQKILRLAGIKDVWSRTEGQTRSKLNLLYACFEALQKLMAFKTNQKNEAALSIVEGSSKIAA